MRIQNKVVQKLVYGKNTDIYQNTHFKILLFEFIAICVYTHPCTLVDIF